MNLLNPDPQKVTADTFCVRAHLATLELEGLLSGQLVLLKHGALGLEQRVRVRQRHRQRQPVVRVVVCDDAVVQQQAAVGLRPRTRP